MTLGTFVLIALGVIIGFALFLVWAVCANAADADEAALHHSRGEPDDWRWR